MEERLYSNKETPKHRLERKEKNLSQQPFIGKDVLNSNTGPVTPDGPSLGRTANGTSYINTRKPPEKPNKP